MDHHDETQGGGDESGFDEAAGEPSESGKTDREEGGPTAPSEPTEETQAGEAHGTRPSEMEPHE